MIFCGIDPGLDGAVATIDDQGGFIEVQDAPTITVKRAKGNKRLPLAPAMATLLEQQIKRHKRVMVAIEDVHSMPGQGVVAMFSMGTGFGMWLGILAALRLPNVRVPPRTWKKALGIPSGAEKTESIVRALQLFPTAPLTRKRDHNRAEALLIAEYARRAEILRR